MQKLVLQTHDAALRFGVLLGELCASGDIICMKGKMGAGKTTITQAIAKGCGISAKEYVSSPTYALVHQYEGCFPMYHMDFYRLTGCDDVIANGLDEFFYQPGLSVIEWYEVALELLPEKCLFLAIEITGENERQIQFSSNTKAWKNRITTLFKRYKN